VMAKRRRNPESDRAKICRYCAYQERTHREVRQKLYSMGLSTDDVEETIAFLITNGFLNEERFAIAYAGGKFRQLKWGRLKIINGLERKGVSSACIRRGLTEIGEDDYLETLNMLLEEKLTVLDEPDAYVKRNKVSRYAIGKGYEPDLVWAVVKSLIPPN
jgi:regulatory protein